MPVPVLMPNFPLLSPQVLALYGSAPGQEGSAAVRCGGNAITAVPVVPENYGRVVSFVAELDGAVRRELPQPTSTAPHPLPRTDDLRGWYAQRCWEESRGSVTGGLREMTVGLPRLEEDGRSIAYQIDAGGLLLCFGQNPYPGDLTIHDSFFLPSSAADVPPYRLVKLTIAHAALRQFLGLPPNTPRFGSIMMSTLGISYNEWHANQAAASLLDAARRFEKEVARKMRGSARSIVTDYQGGALSLSCYFRNDLPLSPPFLSYWEWSQDALAVREGRRNEIHEWARAEMEKDPEEALEAILREAARASRDPIGRPPPALRLVSPIPEDDLSE